MNEHQEQLAREFVGTVDTATGLLLENVDSNDNLYYVSPPCDPYHDTGGQFKFAPTKDHSAIKKAFAK